LSYLLLERLGIRTGTPEAVDRDPDQQVIAS
jgi:hypothetical protein